MDLNKVKDGTSYIDVRNSRNLELIPTKEYWNTGIVTVVDTKNGAYIKAKVNGTSLWNVSLIYPPRNNLKGDSYAGKIRK